MPRFLSDLVRRSRSTRSVALAASLLLAGSGAVVSVSEHADAAPAASSTTPNYTVSKVVTGLNVPWDLTFMGSTMMYDLRGGGIYTKSGTAAPRKVTLANMPKLFVGVESGMMGLVADPDWATNKYFYTCQSVATSSGRPGDIRVLRWTLDSATHASVNKTMIKGLPISSGRHGGCRLRFSAYKYLYVGTGDAATGTNPQNLHSLGGKILRLTHSGAFPSDNPFLKLGGNARYIWNYGHRNVQGLALRPGTSELWSVEQGTDRDDEVNGVGRGGNYGYNPVPGYNESVPMTDTRKYPNAARARWSSGYPTIATSGATFLSGSRWKNWNGALAVGVLKGEQIKLFSIAPGGHTTKPLAVLTSLQGRHRIRTVQLGPDGALYFTTSDGSGDFIGKITPR